MPTRSRASRAGAPRERGAHAEPVRIGELARATGLSRQALHNYVLLGLIAPAGRTAGGHRLFDAEAFRRIGLIGRLCRSGYTLRDIREIFMQGKGAERA